MTKTAPANVANQINRARIKTMPAIDFVKAYSIYDYIDEYGINHGKGITLSFLKDGQTKNITWAPVNCGYKAKTGDTGEALGYPYGKLYQWGRKYGQGYSGVLYVGGSKEGTISDATYPTTAAGTLINSQVSFAEGDWCTENFKEWSHSKGNDPCPSGWRIPTENELKLLRDGNRSSFIKGENNLEGYYFTGKNDYSADLKDKVFFPAAGSRLSMEGNTINRGNEAYIRISSSSSLCLGFNKWNVSFYNVNTAAGYSVRCVQE